jgi:molybdopterin-containing oxidoreductase family membrane subunit
MFEKVLTGSKKYWSFVSLLSLVIFAGFMFYLMQLDQGLMITGMSQDVSWGLYIAQFTFLVGIAASAVTVVLPYYLHDFRAFGKITILGEFLAISSVVMCLAFIFVDMGQPFRAFNVFLHPSPRSLMFWDAVVLLGYLFINLVIGWTTLGAERKRAAPPSWVRPLIYISIPWAVSIHTVTAFLYAGIPGRDLWLSAIVAARFLASAFAGGPSLLILLCAIVRRTTGFDPGREPIEALAKIVVYTLTAHVFFILLEFFTAFYSGIPSHRHSLEYLFFGLQGYTTLVPYMWMSAILALSALVLLVNPRTRRKESTLTLAALGVIISTWIDKGVGFVVGGFIPNPLGKVSEYTPTAPEIIITLGIWALGLLVLTLLFKITISVREEV